MSFLSFSILNILLVSHFGEAQNGETGAGVAGSGNKGLIREVTLNTRKKQAVTSTTGLEKHTRTRT